MLRVASKRTQQGHGARAKTLLNPVFSINLAKMNDDLEAFLARLDAEDKVSDSFVRNQLRLIAVDLLRQPQCDRLSVV
jgi:ribosome assembly protein YihI (activator of Der GTPase)